MPAGESVVGGGAEADNGGEGDDAEGDALAVHDVLLGCLWFEAKGLMFSLPLLKHGACQTLFGSSNFLFSKINFLNAMPGRVCIPGDGPEMRMKMIQAQCMGV